MRSTYERWLSKVKVNEETSCWEWQGATTRGGYGHLRKKRGDEWIMQKAHRFSYEHHNNVSLEKDENVCHSCDNPKCVNPAHLFKGTYLDNSRDMFLKGRWKLPRNKNHVLLDFDIADKIRQEYAKGGKSMAEVGKIFNTSAAQVCRIVKNQIWKVG